MTRSELIQAFAPTGRLRAAINVGNPILAYRNSQDAGVSGISVDLARGWAEQLGVPLELIVLDTAAASVDQVARDEADIGFFAIDPKRGEGVAFTEPYVLIEGCYLVREDSPLTDNAQVDQAAHRVAVGQGSAYDLYLSRELRQARIERAPSSPAVVAHFLAQGADVAAGVKQQIAEEANRLGGLRLLPGHFMLIRQAVGCPRSRGEAAALALGDYLRRMKASGFVAQALARHGVQGVALAP
jgi:polar amino acid transport system substrate-binding protein